MIMNVQYRAVLSHCSIMRAYTVYGICFIYLSHVKFTSASSHKLTWKRAENICVICSMKLPIRWLVCISYLSGLVFFLHSHLLLFQIKLNPLFSNREPQVKLTSICLIGGKTHPRFICWLIIYLRPCCSSNYPLFDFVPRSRRNISTS